MNFTLLLMGSFRWKSLYPFHIVTNLLHLYMITPLTFVVMGAGDSSVSKLLLYGFGYKRVSSSSSNQGECY